MNTLCIDYNGNYVDKLDAIKDIENKVIRTVKDSNISFNEDPLRMVRALRFQMDLDFTLSDDVENSINLNKDLIKNISHTRLAKEIEKSKNKDRLLEVINYEG